MFYRYRDYGQVRKRGNVMEIIVLVGLVYLFFCLNDALVYLIKKGEN